MRYLYAAGVVAVLIGANVFTFKAWQSARESLAVQRLRAEQLDGQLSALHEQIARAAKARALGERHVIEVRNEANKTDWGATGVPNDVVRVLCQQANCAAATVHSPGS